MIDFYHKTVNDPIHGSIHLSELEFKIIKTPTFLRLNRLNHLGLAHFVFPGSTHTRMSHSLGSLKTMTQMIDSINRNCKEDKAIDEGEKQKLRVAALLHDIGHYPLSHASEVVFYRIAEENPKDKELFEEKEDGIDTMPLNSMGQVRKVKRVSHERFGQFLIEKREDVAKALKEHGLNPEEIGAIIIGERPQRQIYSQLIHSALDADRLDYLLRDSHYTGVTYGNVDLEFLVKNLKYDPKTEMFAVDYKGIPSFEHYLIARFYMYNNIIYHKSIMSFELMAKSLYYKMVDDGCAIGDFDDLKRCSIENENNWFSFYHDEYFWNKLKGWNPEDKFYQKLKDDLINRRGLKLLFEERQLIDCRDKDNIEGKFKILQKRTLQDSTAFNNLIKKYNITKDCLALTDNIINFEDQSPYTGHRETTPDEISKELGRVYENYEFKDLIAVKYSIIGRLSEYSQHIRRLYLFDMNNIIKNDSIREKFRKDLLDSFSD